MTIRVGKQPWMDLVFKIGKYTLAASYVSKAFFVGQSQVFKILYFVNLEDVLIITPNMIFFI